MSASVSKGQALYYFVPGPSRHPMMAATGSFVALGQAVGQRCCMGPYSVALGVVVVGRAQAVVCSGHSRKRVWAVQRSH